MNIINNSVFIFIFLIFIFNINFSENAENLIKNKAYLFIISSIFQLLIMAIYKIKYNCKSKFKNLFNNSLITGVFIVIGYSIYIDLLNIESTRNILLPYISTNNKFIHSVIISTIISLFFLIGKTLELLVIDNPTRTLDCNKE